MRESKQRVGPAVLALLAVTFMWGLTFVWMKQATNASGRLLGDASLLGSTWFIALRFALAALFLVPFPQCWRDWNKDVWKGATLLGGILLAGFLLQMAGLEGVSPAVSAFLTSLYVVFTALLVTIRTRRRPTIWLLGGVAMATLGGAYIGGPPRLTFGTAEWLTVGCAFLFAVHILLTDALTKRHAAMPITLLSFVVVAIGAGITLAMQLARAEQGTFSILRTLTIERDFLVPLLCSSLFATTLALTLMNVYQRRLDPIRAAILYALEPVWAALVALQLGMGSMNRWLLLGGSALLLGNLIAEIGPAWGARKRAGGGS